MKVLFISKHKHPHIGGVEVHLRELTKELEKKNYEVNTISEEDIRQPKIKIIGLLYIWYWFLKNIRFIKEVDIIHIHDVFIWYLPFRFIFSSKKVYITFHGWEGKFPIPLWNIINKRVANKLMHGCIVVGKYIEKYYGIKADYIIRGGINPTPLKLGRADKIKNTIVWLGRTDQDTGYLEFQNWLSKQKTKYIVMYVTNVKNPEKYLRIAEYCVPSGYLSYLEAKSYGCKIITFANNPLKEDYWNEIKLLKKIPTWDEVVDVYLKLWKK